MVYAGTWIGPREAVGGIWGSDIDARVIEAAQRNAERAGVSVQFGCGRANTVLAPSENGLLICNPPYGLRLRQSKAYSILGQMLSGPFANWRAGIICPDERARRALGRAVHRRIEFSMGGLGLEFCVLEPKA